MTAVSVFLMWTLPGDWVIRKSKRGRRILVGRPVMVVRDGQILTEIVERERMAAEDILAAAREQGFADLSGISVAVLEDDGKLSFVPNPDGPKPGGG
ncbi:MAG: YetF domain-containing protein [Acidimicrobiia bacterium]